MKKRLVLFAALLTALTMFFSAQAQKRRLSTSLS